MMIQPINNSSVHSRLTFKSIIQPTPVLRKTLETTISNLKYNEKASRLEGKLFAKNLNAILNDGKIRFLEFNEYRDGNAMLTINSSLSEIGNSNWDYNLEPNKIEQIFHGNGTKLQIAALAKQAGIKKPLVELNDVRFQQIDSDEIPWIQNEIDELHKIDPKTDSNFLAALENIYRRITANLKEKVINDLEEIKSQIFSR